MIMRSLAATRLAARSLRPVSRSTSAALLVSTPNVATTHSSRRLHTSSPCRKQGGDDIPSERPPTNFSELDVLGGMPAPSTSVDVCMHDGFGLNSGITISGGDGAMLVNGEAFSWRPWEAVGQKRLLNSKGQFDIPAETLGMLDLLWPRPDLLIIGVGKEIRPLSPETRKVLAEMGFRVEVLDTRNAASQFNMLATERGITDVAAMLIPIGWREGVGAQP